MSERIATLLPVKIFTEMPSSRVCSFLRKKVLGTLIARSYTLNARLPYYAFLFSFNEMFSVFSPFEGSVSSSLKKLGFFSGIWLT